MRAVRKEEKGAVAEERVANTTQLSLRVVLLLQLPSLEEIALLPQTSRLLGRGGVGV